MTRKVFTFFIFKITVTVLHFNLTIRGTEDEFMPKLEECKPLYISAVPMTLEEIFISEMGAAGYDAENII